MTMHLKIRPIGNSLGLVLPKELLSELRLEKDDEVVVTRTQNGFEISPYEADLADVQEWIEKGAKRYRNALRALSK
ncbi:MAG: AbrB/MazE/SpoVT family DNA-binding domain-containing protein [Aquisalinus sp.]|nr:AbrB/MazE/SpoVT family DNA-binding domain-containing protein [Aquisalinus sp.]